MSPTDTLRESNQSKNVSVPNASLASSFLAKNVKTLSFTDLGGPAVNAVWLINFIVVKYKSFLLSSSLESIKATPIGRVTSAGVIVGEVQAAQAELKPTETEKEKQLGPLTLAFQFVQPPIVEFGQDFIAEVELEGNAIAIEKHPSEASLSQGILSMGYTYKQIHGYHRA